MSEYIDDPELLAAIQAGDQAAIEAWQKKNGFHRDSLTSATIPADLEELFEHGTDEDVEKWLCERASGAGNSRTSKAKELSGEKKLLNFWPFKR